MFFRFLFAILPLSVTSEEVRSRSHEICHIAAHHRIHAAVFSHILRPDLLSHRSALTPGELTGLTPRPITRHTHPCGHQRSSERKCRTRKVIRPTRVAARQSRSLQAPCQNPPPPPPLLPIRTSRRLYRPGECAMRPFAEVACSMQDAAGSPAALISQLFVVLRRDAAGGWPQAFPIAPPCPPRPPPSSSRAPCRGSIGVGLGLGLGLGVGVGVGA